jgi:hypothetical protein
MRAPARRADRGIEHAAHPRVSNVLNAVDALDHDDVAVVKLDDAVVALPLTEQEPSAERHGSYPSWSPQCIRR